MEGSDPFIRLQSTVTNKFSERLRSITSYKGSSEEERLHIARELLDPLFSDLAGRTKSSFVRHIKRLLKRSAGPDQIRQILDTLSALEAVMKPYAKNARTAISLWDILSDARTQLTEYAFQRLAAADIPNQKDMEKALKASEERYRALVEGTNEYIMVISEEKIVYANPKMIKDASLSLQELQQKSFTDFIYKDDLPVVMDYYRKRFEGDIAPHNYSMRIVDTMGDIRWMQVSSIPITWDDRPAVLVLLTDISRLKHVEEALQKSEQKMREVSSNIPVLAYQFYARDNGDIGFYYISGQSMKLFGISPEPEGFFERFTELVLPEYRESFLASNDNAIRTVSEWQFEGKLQKPSGEVIWFRGNSIPHRQKNETVFNGVVLDITEQKRSEEALKESEKKFRDIAQLAPQIIYEIDAEHHLTFVNKEAERMLGLTGEDVHRHLNILTLFPPEEHPRVRYHLEQMIQGKKTRGNEYTMVRKDGTTIPVIAYSSPIFRNDNIVGYRGTIIDITERKKTEQALQESEMKYRNIFENAVEGFFQSTPEGRFVSVNPAMAKMCGYESPEEMINSITDLESQFYVYPEDRKAFMERMATYGVDENFAHQVYRKDGSIIWISSNVRAVRDASGKIIFYEGTNEDITKHKKAELALTESELFLKQTQSIARLGGWKANPHTDYLECTDGIYDIIEAPRDYKSGLAEGLKYFLPRYIPFIRDKIINCLRTGETFIIEAEVITETGKKLWTEVRGLAPIVEGGRSYVAGTLQDISERKKSEERILESEQAQRAILQASPIGICRIKNRCFEWVNEYMCTITGYSYDEIQGRRARFLYYDEAEFNRVGDTLYREGMAETKWVRKDGVVRDIFLQISLTGSHAYILTVSDITERKQLESQLFQAQKMEAVGTLAGGVAHDFNNILSAIMGYASLLQIKIGRDSPLSAYVAQILTSSERAAQLTQSLLAFSRKQRITMKPFSLNEAVANIQKLLTRLLTEDIELKTYLTHERLVVLGDVNQIDQVVMNLVTNARDSMPRGGTISIHTSRFTMDSKFVATHGFGKPGKYAQAMVSDTGTGIDEHILPKIFEPFFTTKAVGKGTGLGLSLVYGIVDQHNGYIDVKSRPNKGASFFIYLPLVTQHVETKDDQGTGVSSRGTEKILIAEDNEEVRNLISMVLRENGYTVITAKDGLEAIRVFSERAVDMVILDVIMPKMNGKEVLDALRKQRPSQKVLFMSGYTYDIIQEKGIPEEGIDLIMKPLKPGELLKKVRELLDS